MDFGDLKSKALDLASGALGSITGGVTAPDLKNTTRIRTPHAAIVVWNYDNRISATPSSGLDNADKIIISPVSIMAISTSKSKGDPQGSFNFVLAPTRNWVAQLTPGSWCVILMGNSPITQDDVKKVNPSQLKMIGKIDTVRLDTKANSDGSRSSAYYVSGVDWGHVFHNVLYIDSNLTAPTDPMNQGNGAFIAIAKILFGEKGVPTTATTSANIAALLKVFGSKLAGFSDTGASVNVLTKSVYEFNLPTDMSKFLGLNSKGAPASNINSALELITGKLSGQDKYSQVKESFGFIDPFSLQGTNTFWQILQSNSCPALNEMVAEMRPGLSGTQLVLYNRIKPFAIKGALSSTILQGLPGGRDLVSYFQDLKVHEIDPYTVTAINAGTNWRDKYNFVEIKPIISQFPVVEAGYKQYTQSTDEKSFSREGFRPMIVASKYLPASFYSNTQLETPIQNLKGWVYALRTWFFDTHKMLNGTVSLTGIDGHIAVGDNIKLDAALLNPNTNFNSAIVALKNSFLLAHVESVSHSFSVGDDGARTYTTNIQFVRGIFVNNSLLPLVASLDAGAVESKQKNMTKDATINSESVIATPSPDAPKI